MHICAIVTINKPKIKSHFVIKLKLKINQLRCRSAVNSGKYGKFYEITLKVKK